MTSNIDLIKTLAEQVAENEKLRTELELMSNTNDELTKKVAALKTLHHETIYITGQDGSIIDELINCVTNHITRFCCNGVLVEIKHSEHFVTAIYPDGLEFKWFGVCTADTNIVKLSINGESAEVYTNHNGYMEIRLAYKDSQVAINSKNYLNHRYDLLVDNHEFAVYKRVDMKLGKYDCVLEYDDYESDRFTITDEDDKEFIITYTNAAPLIRINDSIAFDCDAMRFIIR